MAPGLSLQNLKVALRNPTAFFGLVRWGGVEINKQIHKRYYQQPNGLSVMEADWDNLLILDACRYDMFAETCGIDGKLTKQVSRGSNSRTFIRANFRDDTHHDTIYITTNPNVAHVPDGTFFKIVELFDDEYINKLGVVPPEEVVEAVIEEHQAHPDKRLIVHFMQPHVPFLGDNGRSLSEGDSVTVWSKLQFNLLDTSVQEVWDAYIENLKLVLDYVEDLLPEIPGKSVITSDHGNLVGERLGPIPVKDYGHDANLYHPKLIEVPWLSTTVGERREIVRATPIDGMRTDDAVIKDRLESLGYR